MPRGRPACFALALVLGLVLAPSMLAACPLEPPSDGGVMRAEAIWVRGLRKRDTAAVSCVLSKGFRDVNWRGEILAREQVLQNLRRGPPRTLTISGLSVVRAGHLAVVTGENRQVSNDPLKSGSVRFVDLFEYEGGAWRARLAQETLIAGEPSGRDRPRSAGAGKARPPAIGAAKRTP